MRIITIYMGCKMIRLVMCVAILFVSGVVSSDDSDSNKDAWLTSSLYGHDNSDAALKKVVIRKDLDGYKIHVTNQFNFECDLRFNEMGDPAVFASCLSKDAPQPICNPNKPDSLCAVRSGCFRTKNETKVDCFRTWVVEESRVKLKCTSLKKEQVCRGGYTLTAGSYSSKGEFVIARRVK